MVRFWIKYKEHKRNADVMWYTYSDHMHAYSEKEGCIEMLM